MFNILFGSLLFMTTAASLPAVGLTEMCQIECQIAPHQRVHARKSHSDSHSTNWSGYAALTNRSNPKKKSVSKVSGTWTVPKLKKSKKKTFSSIWVGIDGYGSSTVEQIGTEHDWEKGKQKNYAWFEMYPRGSFQIMDFPVNAGDRIGAQVHYQGNDTFKLSIYNYTQKVFTVVPSSYTKAKNTQRVSAEWIVEAPSDGRKILPLADFKKVRFTKCRARITGKSGSIKNKRWKTYDFFMVTQGKTKAKPSGLKKSGKAFTVSWNHR